MKTFRLMWDDFCIAWKTATPTARWLLALFTLIVVGWTVYAAVKVVVA